MIIKINILRKIENNNLRLKGWILLFTKSVQIVNFKMKFEMKNKLIILGS